MTYQETVTRAAEPANNSGTPAFCTGYGGRDTHAITLSNGEPNKSRKAGTPYNTVTGAEIVGMVKDPPSVDKDKAQWIIPSDYTEHDGRGHEAQRSGGRFWWLSLDVDENNLALRDVGAAVDTVSGGARRLTFSTRSAKPDDRKWRALIPLAEPIAGADYADTVEAFNDLLEEASDGVLIPDRALQRPGQLVYLPNKGEFYDYEIQKGKRLHLTADHPIIKRREETRRQRAKAEAAAREWKVWKASQAPTDADSIIDAFNATSSIAAMLEHYGYKQAGQSNDWRSPMQSSGSYATRDFGEYWVSLSASDAAAGLGRDTKTGQRFGDAFDLFVHFEHGGDFKAAIKAYAKEIRQDYASKNKGKGGNTYKYTGLDLVRDDKDRPIWNMANAVTLLSKHDDWQGVLAFNRFTMRPEVLKPIPGQPVDDCPRNMTDNDYTTAQEWFNRNGFPRASASIVVSAVNKVSRNQSHDPLTTHLNTLRWDGVGRIGTWLVDYIGAEDNAYTREVGKRWLIAAVARAYKPGCKVDNMIVLEGAQGARKSTALAVLAGNGWFGDALPPMNHKDASSYLRGHWIIEVAELEAMRREVDAVKAFLSRQVEHFRESYGRLEGTEPRRCVFAGTTNKDDWQRDETGGRRFWPVKVGTIDIPALKRDRDQLWAEAIKLFRAGERWWLSDEAEAMAAVEVAERRTDDPWRAAIAHCIVDKDEVASRMVLGDMGRMPSEMTPYDSKRVNQELVGLGWVRDGQFTRGEFKGAARYVRGPRAEPMRKDSLKEFEDDFHDVPF